MQRVPVVVGSLMAAAMLAGAVVLDRARTDDPHVDVVFGQFDGVAAQIDEGARYEATFTITWEGPVDMRDGTVRVFMSRRGDTTEDAPADGWPLQCESDFDNVIGSARLTCPFVAPGPGAFAMLLRVESPTGKALGETLYTHEVIDPTATTAD